MPLTPMMTHYVGLKEKYSDCLLFYRLGDFYEMFFEDAEVTSRELGLTLTGREGGLDKRIPMCGVPHHAARIYIKRLLDKGYSVAMCEQVGEVIKGKPVEREVVRVITPGTIIEEDFLDEASANYIASVYMNKSGVGSISWADITTGQFYAKEIKVVDDFFNAIAQIMPKEIISTTDFKTLCSNTIGYSFVTPSNHYEYAFSESTAYDAIINYFNIKSTTVFDFDKTNPITISAGALLEYLHHTQKKKLVNIAKIAKINDTEHMALDKTAREHLELTHQFRKPSEKYGSLLWVLDSTKTSMGSRLLSNILSNPLYSIKRINQRLDAIEALIKSPQSMAELANTLSQIKDITRLSGKIAAKEVLPAQMLMLAKSLNNIEEVKKTLVGFSDGLLRLAFETLSPMNDIVNLIERAIETNLPAKIDEGGYIAEGYNKDLDSLRKIGHEGRSWIANLEIAEQKECGLKELKIGYNRVTGYYFEVPKRFSDKVPYRLERIATTTNAERYTTEELKNIATKVATAQEEIITLERRILNEIRDVLVDAIPTIQKNGEQIAIVDALCSLASVAKSNKWCRPKINDEGVMKLKDVRHPVVEKIIGTNKYIANDCDFSKDSITTKIITGPNMAGKSTYMRSIAANVILATIGSFVPCSSAEIPLTDRIFTRIGASDSLITSESTFMVELNQISVLLNNATKSSLLLIDELGRGTGTQEGKAIASATISYATDKIGCMAMFATHFHELASLAEENSKIKNYRATTSVIDGNIVFLHKILPGKEEQSFGIEVAKLAGLPKEVIDNAKKLYELDKATQQQLAGKNVGPAVIEKEVPIKHPVISKLQEIDVNHLSPMESLTMLGDLIKEANS